MEFYTSVMLAELRSDIIGQPNFELNLQETKPEQTVLCVHCLRFP